MYSYKERKTAHNYVEIDLGWKPRLTIQTGVERTIQILKDLMKDD